VRGIGLELKHERDCRQASFQPLESASAVDGSRRLLHRLLPVSIARFSRCGFHQCVGDPGGFASPSAAFGVQAAVFAGVIMFVALAITPWLRPVWLQLIAAVVIAGLLTAFWIGTILFT
jgi:hypothetical protein